MAFGRQARAGPRNRELLGCALAPPGKYDHEYAPCDAAYSQVIFSNNIVIITAGVDWTREHHIYRPF